MPIVFSSNYGYIQQGAVLGNTASNPYYINSIGSGFITIGTYISNTLTAFNPGTYSNSTTTAMVYTKTLSVSKTNNDNTIDIGSGQTAGLVIGMPVVFQNNLDVIVSRNSILYQCYRQ